MPPFRRRSPRLHTSMYSCLESIDVTDNGLFVTTDNPAVRLPFSTVCESQAFKELVRRTVHQWKCTHFTHSRWECPRHAHFSTQACKEYLACCAIIGCVDVAMIQRNDLTWKDVAPVLKDTVFAPSQIYKVPSWIQGTFGPRGHVVLRHWTQRIEEATFEERLMLALLGAVL